MTTTKPTFVKHPRRAGEYTVKATSVKSGQTFLIKVQKTEVLNPSTRGGAYRVQWVASFGLTRKTGDTRQEAFQALLSNFAGRGIKLTY